MRKEATDADRCFKVGQRSCNSINIHVEHQRPAPRHRAYGRNLLVALAASGSVFVVEVWAAWLTGSLALLSDAGHLLVDLSGLVIAYVALRIASRPATPQATYGFVRAEVLAAMLNGVLIFGVGAFIVIRAWRRLQDPLVDLDHSTVLWVAILGLVANLVAARILQHDAKESINTRAAWFNVLGDALASVGVIVSALLVRWTSNTAWDTYVSFLVAAIIVFAAWTLVRSSAAILLEVSPPGIRPGQVKRTVESLDDVVNVHDLHVWTHTPGQHSATLHVSIRSRAVPRFYKVTKDIEELLMERFGLDHCTIQVEPEGEDRVSDHFDPVEGVVRDPTHPQ